MRCKRLRFMKAKYLLSNLFRQGFGSQLRRNMVSGVFCTGINALALMAAYPIYLHFLGYEKYGVWLVLATVLSFAQLGDLGIGQAMMKLVAEEHGRKNVEGIQKYVVTAILILLVSGSIALAAILVFKSHIIGLFKLSDENARTALWLLPYIGVLSIYVFVVQALNATLSGLGRMDMANFARALGRIIAVSIATLMLYRGNGIESILIGNSVSYVFIHLMSIICIKRIALIRFLRKGNLDGQYGKRILRFGGVVFGGGILSMLFSPFNKLMLSRYAGVSTIPIYEIAFTGSMQVKGLVEAGLRALMPEVSRIGASMTKYAKDRISQIYRRAMKIVFFFGIPMYGALIIFAPLLLRVWLGEKFIEALPCVFRIMLVGSFLSLLGVPAFYTLMGVGRVRSCFWGFCIPSVINVLLVVTIVIFLRTLAIQHIAYSGVVGISGSTIYLMWQVHSTHAWLRFDERGAKVESLGSTSVG